MLEGTVLRCFASFWPSVCSQSGARSLSVSRGRAGGERRHGVAFILFAPWELLPKCGCLSFKLSGGDIVAVGGLLEDTAAMPTSGRVIRCPEVPSESDATVTTGAGPARGRLFLQLSKGRRLLRIPAIDSYLDSCLSH